MPRYSPEEQQLINEVASRLSTLHAMTDGISKALQGKSTEDNTMAAVSGQVARKSVDTPTLQEPGLVKELESQSPDPKKETKQKHCAWHGSLCEICGDCFEGIIHCLALVLCCGD